ncbi:MAG: RNA 3'-terminal phosphate cyclase [Minisyncoccales bacterium]
MIKIDGSYLEGGGQILRTATALSVITQLPCHIFNIRQTRPKPGLATQHLLGLQALAQFCSGRLEGDELGSTEIKFYPGSHCQNSISIKIPTAGSITLILQSLILPALLSNQTVRISFEGGATDTFFSPPFDYFQFVFLKILEKMGGQVEVNLRRRGYYPTGGAQIEVKTWPIAEKQLGPLNLTKRGELKRILILSGAAESLKEKKVAERQISGVKEILGKLKLPLEEKIEYYKTDCPGSQINLIAEFENTIMGVNNLGKLGKKAETVGKEAALELLKEEKSGACLDKYSADQILPYLPLTKNKSSITVSEITSHCQTNIWVVEKFFKGKFQIENNLITWLAD